MAFSHKVPEGKTLYVKAGGYNFIGPNNVSLSGGQTLPPTYTDGTSTAAQSIEPKKVIIDKMALPMEEMERSAPPPSKLSQHKMPYKKKK